MSIYSIFAHDSYRDLEVFRLDLKIFEVCIVFCVPVPQVFHFSFRLNIIRLLGTYVGA